MITNISCGSYHSLTIGDNSVLHFTGSTKAGKSGLHTPVIGGQLNQFTPIDLPMTSKIVHVSSGTGQVFLLCEDNTLSATGANAAGQLGIDSDIPVINCYTQITTLPKPAQYVASNRGHTLVLLVDGSLWATGYNANGQLGLGTTEDKKRFTQISQLPAGKTI